VKSRILIAGAGLGGLAAAANMLEAGHDVTIFEQAPQLGEVGAGIQMSANAMHVLRSIGVSERIEAVGVKPGAYVFRLFDTGEIVQQFPLAEEHERLHGAPYLQVHRADLHQILVDRVLELKPDAIRLNHRVKGFEESPEEVVLRFEEAEPAHGDLLIGADGLKSVIRKQISGPVPATYTGDAAWRLTVPIERLPADFMEPVMSVFMGPGRHAVMYYLRSGKLVNFVGLVETADVHEESWTARFLWETLKADFVGWHDMIQTVIDAADRDACYRWSLHVRPHIERWSTERVTILGDAAHPTLPYLAQGAVMAIEDGAILRRSLQQNETIPAAIRQYERNRIARTRRIVDQSTANRTLFHLRTADEFRAAFSKRDEGADRNAWLYSYNPLTVPLT